MSKKIENLISKLKEELEKEKDIAFAISTLDPSDGEVTTSFGGSQADIGLALSHMTLNYVDMVKKDPCPCLKCQMVRQMMDIDIYEHSDIEVDEATFNAFMNGGDANG